MPVRVGIDAEFGVPGSTSAQAVRLGVQIAVKEINDKGGVLGGRPLVIEERDNRSVPARSMQNLRELAAMPDLVAVFCGKYSPVVVEALPLLHTLKLPLLDPWAAADSITEHEFRPSYTFRLSLKDSWALDALLSAAQQRGAKAVGLLVPNTEWGRSSLRATSNFTARHPALRITGVRWYNWGDDTLLPSYRELLGLGSQALILVANEREGALAVREIAALPDTERRPIYAHWGVTGGQFFENARDALRRVDFYVVQTFSFLGEKSAKATAVGNQAIQLAGVGNIRQLQSPVGVAHAYDLMHILARAIGIAGSTDRAAVRDALEKVRDYNGLVRRYRQPFSQERHEALGPEQVGIARYANDGAIETLPPPKVVKP